MAALPQKADIQLKILHVRFGAMGQFVQFGFPGGI
jgi:hypothetical protein